jgi:UDP-glucose 4-epimerase
VATVLVTGGAGYVGSHAAAELVRRGHAVAVLDDLSKGHRKAVPASADFHQTDLADYAAVKAVFGKHRFDAVLHFAANSQVGESMREPMLYLGDNVMNAANLVRAAGESGVRKFVLSSTSNLFDGTGDRPIAEDRPIAPASPYGESKYMVERLLKWAETIYGIRSACLRYFNAAGADPDGHIGEDHSPETHLIPIVLEVAAGRRPHIEMFGDDYATPDGTCVRDYIHVNDLADAHVRVLDALDQRSCVYNLGNGRGHSVREVVETARRVTGAPIAAKIGPRREGDPAFLVSDSTRVRQELGWNPQHSSLDTIIQTAWNWHRANPNGYGD